LQVARLYQEPDDHVGLELAFLAHLGQLALAAEAEGDPVRMAELLAAERMFLKAHAQRWIPAFCAQVGEHTQSGFYRGVALVTAGVLAELGAALAAAAPPGASA
jgi:TorA maturation chaperone TorD